jgi:hypothetical protein
MHTKASAAMDAAGAQKTFFPDVFSELLPYFDRVNAHSHCPMHLVANCLRDLYHGLSNSGNKEFTPQRR